MIIQIAFNFENISIKLENISVPSSPLNISQIHVTNSSVTLHWTIPSSPNGIIAGYRLYYMSKQVTKRLNEK